MRRRPFSPIERGSPNAQGSVEDEVTVSDRLGVQFGRARAREEMSLKSKMSHIIGASGTGLFSLDPAALDSDGPCVSSLASRK